MRLGKLEGTHFRQQYMFFLAGTLLVCGWPPSSLSADGMRGQDRIGTMERIVQNPWSSGLVLTEWGSNGFTLKAPSPGSDQAVADPKERKEKRAQRAAARRAARAAAEQRRHMVNEDPQRPSPPDPFGSSLAVTAWGSQGATWTAPESLAPPANAPSANATSRQPEATYSTASSNAASRQATESSKVASTVAAPQRDTYTILLNPPSTGPAEASPPSRISNAGFLSSSTNLRNSGAGLRVSRAGLPDWVNPPPFSDADLRLFRQNVLTHPSQPEPYQQLADALYSRAEWESLRTLAWDWQAYDPDNPLVYEMMGIAALSQGDDRAAARAFSALIDLGPADPALLERAGLLLTMTSEYPSAEAPLRRALELRPDDANAYRHLAMALWQQDRPGEAARVLERALARPFPDEPGVHAFLRDELGYLYRAMLADEGDDWEIRLRARERGIDLRRDDGLRIILTWEDETADLDLHVVDPGLEESYQGPTSSSIGLVLSGNMTHGPGLEVAQMETLRAGTYYVGVSFGDGQSFGDTQPPGDTQPFADGRVSGHLNQSRVVRGTVLVMYPEFRRHTPLFQVQPFSLVRGSSQTRHVLTLDVLSRGTARPAGETLVRP